MYGSVKVWQETLSLPTWTVGEEDRTRCFWKNGFIRGLQVRFTLTA